LDEILGWGQRQDRPLPGAARQRVRNGETVARVLADLEALEAELGKADASQAGRQDGNRKKWAKLHEHDKTVLSWNDRRTHDMLPPAADAIALADMVQRMHHEMTKDAIANKLPIVVADAASLSPEDDAKLQARWTELVEGTGSVAIAKTPQASGLKTGRGRGIQTGDAGQFRPPARQRGRTTSARAAQRKRQDSDDQGRR